jgi:hypothetical protein
MAATTAAAVASVHSGSDSGLDLAAMLSGSSRGLDLIRSPPTHPIPSHPMPRHQIPSHPTLPYPHPILLYHIPSKHILTVYHTIPVGG